LLRLIKKMSELNFSHLMEVYKAQNERDGRKQYPNMSHDEQIRNAEQDF